MASLSILGPGATANAKKLSEETRIPLSYLSKILRKLVLAGLLSSQKGHHGGFALCLPPEDITFRMVLDAVDFDTEQDRCAFGYATCDPKNPCPLHPAWTELNETFDVWADSRTLASVKDAGLEKRRRRSRK
jgi:Rrf2 family protein